MIETATELPPPLVMQYRGESFDFRTRIDEIHAWGTGVVTVRHGVNFPMQPVLPPAIETSLLTGALAGESEAADLLYKTEDTFGCQKHKAYRILGVSTARGALRQLFDPLVGGLEVTEPVELDNEPSPKLIEFMQILARGNPHHQDRASFSVHWSKYTFTKELMRLQGELGVSNAAAVLFWGFASNILGPDSTLLRPPGADQGAHRRAYSSDGPAMAIQKWSPQPRPQTMPEMGARHTHGFSITHPEARDDSTIHFPHDVQAPLDAALTFKGHNLHVGRISGGELLGGRFSINRSHELLSKLTESDLRHLGAGCLGFSGPQAAATFYEAGDGSRQRLNLQDALEVSRRKSKFRQVVDRAFQVGLLVVEKSLDFDLAVMPEHFPDVVRYVPYASYEEMARAWGSNVMVARHAVDRSCARLQVSDRAAIVTVGHLRKLL